MTSGFPRALLFEGRRYSPSAGPLIQFEQLIAGNTLVGFEFLSPEDTTEAFRMSRFVRDSRNVSLDRTLKIWLASDAAAECDQGSYLAAGLFDDGQENYIMIIPRIESYWSRLGFELDTETIPVPEY